MANPDAAFDLRLGDRVELVSMDDPYAIEPGTLGTVSRLCDTPGLEQVVVEWDNGRGLALIPGVDVWRKVG